MLLLFLFLCHKGWSHLRIANVKDFNIGGITVAKHHINRVLTETFNTTTGKCNTEIKLEIPIEILQAGFITKIGGAKHLAVLLAILSHSDAKGESYPTQERIAKLVGMTRQTVSKIINDLLEVTINGSHLISREKVKTGEFVNSVYSYMVPEQVEVVQERTFKSAKDVITYFSKVFKETFGIDYLPMWSRDTALVRDKLYKNLSDDQLKGIIDIAITEYRDRWYKPQFPRPNISMLCGWLGNTALGLYDQRIKEQQEQQARMERDIERELDVASKYI